MNSQRGKASSNASRQNKSKKQGQPTKSKTYGGKNNNNNKNQNPSKGIYNQRPNKNNQRSAAAAYSTGIGQSQPIISRGPNFVRIVHKELITNIIGSATYTIANTFPLNPGMTTFLKWLPTQAVGWETYKWNKIEIKSYTRTGSNVPGSLAIIPDYDASDSAPTDEFVASSYKDLVEDVPWKDQCCLLPNSRLHPMGKELFIRFGPQSGDIKTFDAGNLFLTTTDGTAVAWSKVWAHYDVTLYTPQLPPGGIVALSNMLHLTGTTPTSANAFPTQLVGMNSNSGAFSVPATGEIITFNVSGRFNIQYGTVGTTTTQTGLPTVSASGSLVTTFYRNVGTDQAGSGTAAMNQGVMLDAVPGTTLTFNNTINLGTTWELMIIAVPAIDT